MTTEKVICDECGRMKGASNHWHQIGVNRIDSEVNAEIGLLLGPRTDNYVVLDLCGQQCLYRTIAQILKLNPVPEGEQQS